MKRIRMLPAALLALGMAGSAFAAAAPTARFAGHELASRAKITMPQAEHIALKARPGVITDKELEKEGGGSGLRYSFDIKSRGVVYEVGVDAKTGKVLENDKESAHPD